MYCTVLPDFYSILQHINIQLLSLLSSSSWFVHMISVIESNSLHASCVCVYGEEGELVIVCSYQWKVCVYSPTKCARCYLEV